MDNQNEKEQEVKKEESEDKIKKKRVRRCTKHDTSERAYNCGCGRGYYSYPALYTHLKQDINDCYLRRLKHDGKPPNGTKIPFNQHYGNRGRPKEKCKKNELMNINKVLDTVQDNQKDENDKREEDPIVESSRSPQRPIIQKGE